VFESSFIKRTYLQNFTSISKNQYSPDSFDFLLPSGLLPSALVSHQISRKAALCGSRASKTSLITAGWDLHPTPKEIIRLSKFNIKHLIHSCNFLVFPISIFSKTAIDFIQTKKTP